MKTSSLAVAFIAGAMLFSSCSLFKKDSNDLGGSTDVSFAQVGNEISLGTVHSDGVSLPIDGSVTVIKNDKGEGTVRVDFDMEAAAEDPGTDALADYIMNYILPSAEPDGSGKVSAEVKFKATSEGILDYIYGEPFMIVKYSDPVGTKYTAKTPSGVTQTREIVEKSTSDDFPLGFMYIKVSKVEQQLNAGGIRKVTYYANHKFGLVYWEVTLDDGSTVGSYLLSAN